MERLNQTYGISLVNSDSDLDTSSQPCSQIELVDSNYIHVIRIFLYVTMLYTIRISEVYTVILLRNTSLFPVRFVLISGYYSFLLQCIIIKYNGIPFLKINGTLILIQYQSLLKQYSSLATLHCTPEATGFPHKSLKVCISNSGFVQRSLYRFDEP